MPIGRKEAYDLLTQKIEALKPELPGIALGYLGNYERWGDDTIWYIFLPHYGRVGTYRDSYGLGPGRQSDIFEKALANWSKIEASIHKMYAADPFRRMEAWRLMPCCR